MTDQPTERDLPCAHPVRERLNGGYKRCALCHALLDNDNQPIDPLGGR